LNESACPPLLDVQSLADLLDGQPDGLRLVDARFSLADSRSGRALYLAGHLPGAVFVDLNTDLSQLDRRGHGRHPLPSSAAFADTLGRLGIGTDTRVVVYDDGDGSMAAARFWWMLRAMGHARVSVLDGGASAWQQSGRPLTGEVTDVPILPPYPGQFDGSREATADEVAARLGQAPGWLLDARAPERFSGEIEPLDPVAGHVPGAINRPFALSMADGRMRPAAELRTELQSLIGSHAPSQVVAMCGSGVTACHLLLAMEHAGLEGARLYAGSWSGWITDPSRPVAVGG